jgi:RiboL-PSP-HEPN
MAYSPRFRELLTRLKTLENNFLPEKLKFPATGQYSQQQEDHARAYVLLVHAEIEAYFEDRVQEVVDQAHNQWKQSGTCTKTMERLLRHHLDSQKKPWRSVVKSDDAVNAAISSYSSIVKGNNGVKEANLLAMLFPIGLDYHKLDSTWLVTMDSFGSSRGTFAHTTQIKTQQPINPEDEYKTIKKEVLPPIKKLDDKISRLR